MKCGVCNDADSKYKCPSCSLRYCSLSCYKIHKQQPCSIANDDMKSQTPLNSTSESSSMVTSNISDLSISIPSTSIQSQPSTVARLRKKEAEIVSPEMLQKLQSNPQLVSILESTRLQNQINQILGSVDKHQQLEIAINSFPEFADFIHQMLVVVGARDENGQSLL